MRPVVVVVTWTYIVAFFIAVMPVQADEVFLKNGDLITGFASEFGVPSFLSPILAASSLKVAQLVEQGRFSSLAVNDSNQLLYVRGKLPGGWTNCWRRKSGDSR